MKLNGALANGIFPPQCQNRCCCDKIGDWTITIGIMNNSIGYFNISFEFLVHCYFHTCRMLVCNWNGAEKEEGIIIGNNFLKISNSTPIIQPFLSNGIFTFPAPPAAITNC